MSSIWHDIWGAWCKANYQENLVSTDEVCNQTIWFSSQIRINNTVTYFRNWANGNIMWMKDILSDEGPYKFLNLEEIESRFGIKILLDMFIIMFIECQHP